MKVRRGFVSNSSSSSFVCIVCGTIEAGYDASLSDFEMCLCEAGHLMCQSHVPGYEHLECDADELPSINCPICQLNEVPKDYLHAYALKQLGETDQDLKAAIMQKFDSYESFKASLK